MPDPNPPLPRLNAVVSWIGNSLPGGRLWVQMAVNGICVTPDGTVYTNTPWEENGGEAGMYKDGRVLGYAGHTHGWGAAGGNAVAANSRYVFLAGKRENNRGVALGPETLPEKGKVWIGFTRRLRADFRRAAPFPHGKGGKGDTLPRSFLVLRETDNTDSSEIEGMWADETRVFVSDGGSQEIRVIDAETMQPTGGWKVERPGALAMDRRGGLWAVQRSDGESPARLLRFAADGARMPQTIDLPPGARPTALAIDPKNRLLVADDGPEQRIRIYAGLDGRPALAGAFGARGGIYAGQRGKVGARRFRGLRGVGCDAAGNLYVAQSGRTTAGGFVLESYTPAGALRWRLFGLTFVDIVDVDPADDTQVFTKEERFQLDYRQPPGREGRYAAYTVDRFRYPADPRLHIGTSIPWVRRIQGQRILFVSDGPGNRLTVYRFQGETAVPCGLIARAAVPDSRGWPPGSPAAGGWIWRDRDGDGTPEAGEYQPLAPSFPILPGWWVDQTGGIWMAGETGGVWRLPCDGLDARGIPLWRAARLTHRPSPPEVPSVRRLRYDAAADVLYLGGSTPQDKNQHWKPMGPVLARYDRASSAAPRLRWRIVLPYARFVATHFSSEPMGFDVAGDYLFVSYTTAPKDPLGHPFGHVTVLRAADGAAVGCLQPADGVGMLGLQDLRESLRAWRRKDGEYLVFLEDVAQAKILLYRWRP